VAQAVEVLLSSTVLDEAGAAYASIARVLAAALDASKLSSSGSVAMALPGTAKELRGVIDSIVQRTAETDEFVADLFDVST